VSVVLNPPGQRIARIGLFGATLGANFDPLDARVTCAFASAVGLEDNSQRLKTETGAFRRIRWSL